MLWLACDIDKLSHGFTCNASIGQSEGIKFDCMVSLSLTLFLLQIYRKYYVFGWLMSK